MPKLFNVYSIDNKSGEESYVSSHRRLKDAKVKASKEQASRGPSKVTIEVRPS